MSPTKPAQQRKNVEQWTLLRDSVDKILRRFERDENELIRRAVAARADGFPTGGNAAHGTDVTDSTLAAVLSREQAEGANPAVRALRTFNLAIDHLEAADRHRSGAFPPAPKLEEPMGWCASCLRIKWHSPCATDKKWAQPNAHCSWCSGWLKAHGFLPPIWVMRKHARGDRVYDSDETKAVAEHEAQKVTA